MKTITFPAYPAALTDKNWKSSMDSKDKNTGIGELLREAEQAYKKIKPDFYRAYSQYEANQSKPQTALREFDTKFDSEIAPLASTLIEIRQKAAAIKNPQPKTKAAAAKIIAEAAELGKALGENIFNNAHDNIKEACAIFLRKKETALAALAAATAAREHAIDELETALRTATQMERQAQAGFANIHDLDQFVDDVEAFSARVNDMLMKRHLNAPIRGDAAEAAPARVAPFKSDGNDVAAAATAYHALFGTITPLSKKLVALIKNIETANTAARHQLTKETESVMVQFATLYKLFKQLDNAKLNPKKFDSTFELERNFAKTPAAERPGLVKSCGRVIDLESTNAPAAGRVLKLAQTLMDDIAGRPGASPTEVQASRRALAGHTADFRNYVAALQRATAAYSRIK